MLVFLLCLKLQEMDSVRTFDSEATLTVCEGYDVTEETRAFKRRGNCSCFNCFRRRCSFRVCQIFVFLFIVMIIIPGLGLVTFRTAHTKSISSPGKEASWSPGKQISLIFRSQCLSSTTRQTTTCLSSSTRQTMAPKYRTSIY